MRRLLSAAYSCDYVQARYVIETLTDGAFLAILTLFILAGLLGLWALYKQVRSMEC